MVKRQLLIESGLYKGHQWPLPHIHALLEIVYLQENFAISNS